MTINRERSIYIRDNLKNRIEEQLRAFEFGMPESYVIAWKSYLAGAFEWGELDFPEYQELDRMLPALNIPNPVGDLFIFDERIN